jgi:hypothetical protein
MLHPKKPESKKLIEDPTTVTGSVAWHVSSSNDSGGNVIVKNVHFSQEL